LILLCALAVPLSLAAAGDPPRYTVTDIGTLGGTSSSAVGISNRGSVSGYSFLPGDAFIHGILWREGELTDLGTLGGPNSAVPEDWPPNEKDEVAGLSDTAVLDPYAENFCGFLDFQVSSYICRPFVWRKGVMTQLPTLGGNNAGANAINNRGQVTGLAETSNIDPTCIPPQVFDFQAVIWEPEKGKIRVLPPLPSDTSAAVFGINEKGQATGVSGNCAILAPYPQILTGAIEAVLWERDGTPINLGSLGGKVFNIGFSLNNRGQVVGQSDLPGDATWHAFLWEKGVMMDLGVLYGLPVSLATSINNEGQVVGFSQDFVSTTVAFIWQEGVMTDLNTLIPADSPWFLIEALGINDRGQIAGYAFNAATGEVHGVILTPVPSSESSAQTARSTVRKELPVLSEKVLKLLKRRMGARLHWPSPPS
jgi:probable HAF family extracellular repeat protein